MANWFTRAAENVWDGIKNAPESAAETYQNAINTTSNAIESTINGASAAWDWGADTAAPAVSEFSATTLSVVASPIILASKVTGIGDDSDIIKSAEERAAGVGRAIANFSEFAVDNPARAGGLATQGVINAVSTTVGLAADLGRSVTWDWTTRNVVNLGSGIMNGVYNLGVEEGQEADWHIDSTKFLASSEYLNENLQVRNLYDKPEDSVWADIQLYIKDENGKNIPNPNADYERVLLYGPQSIAEVAIFLGIGSVTMGAGSALYAGARTLPYIDKVGAVVSKVPLVGERITQAASAIGNKVNPTITAEQMKQADLVHDLGEVSEKVRRAEQKSEAIVNKAEDALEKAKNKLDDLEKPPEPAATSTTTTQTTEQTANATNSAQTTSTASAQQLEQAKESVILAEKQLEQAVIKGEAHVGKVTDQAMRKTASLRRVDDLNKAGSKLDELTPGTAEYAKAEKEFDKLFRKGFLKDVFKDSPDLAHLKNKMDDMVKAVQDAKTGIKSTENALKQVKKTGTADEISAAKQAVSDAKDNLKDVKIKTRTGLDDTADEVQKLGYVGHITESYKAGVYKGLHRWLNIRDHPILEGTMALGVTAVGVHIDQKLAAKRDKDNTEAYKKDDSQYTTGAAEREAALEEMMKADQHEQETKPSHPTNQHSPDSTPQKATENFNNKSGAVLLPVKECFEYLAMDIKNQGGLTPTQANTNMISHRFNNPDKDFIIKLDIPLNLIKTTDDNTAQEHSIPLPA